MDRRVWLQIYLTGRTHPAYWLTNPLTAHCLGTPLTYGDTVLITSNLSILKFLPESILDDPSIILTLTSSTKGGGAAGLMTTLGLVRS